MPQVTLVIPVEKAGGSDLWMSYYWLLTSLCAPALEKATK